MRLDSTVGLATRYGLDSLEIDSRSGRYLPHATRVALEPTPPSGTEVKERVKKYFNSHSGASWSGLN